MVTREEKRRRDKLENGIAIYTSLYTNYAAVSVNHSVTSYPWTVAWQAPSTYGILQARTLQ